LPAVLSGEVEVAEILLGDLVAELAERRDRLVGLPVFPARRFAHRYLWVAVDSPARSLADLAGVRVGYPPGGATAAVWTSALLERSGIDARFEPGPLGGALARMLDRGAAGPTLTARLAAGELDAVCTPYAIPPADGGHLLRPLLADPVAAEREEARASGPAPIANVLVMNRAAYERDPGRVPAIVDAFRRARELGRSGLLATPATAALPRIAERIADAEAACGGDPYPYGLEANRHALTTFVRHAAAIGLVAEPPEVAAMFPSEAAAG
jgi:4,5-dihydroxyphthalate decarboxylase